MKKLTTEEFKYRAKLIYGNKYNYDEAVYDGITKKVKLFCNDCKNYIFQTASQHLKGLQCKKCLHLARFLTTSKFIELANVVFNGFYSYKKTNYIRSIEKIIITCPIHDDFEMLPANHLQGLGCKKCGTERTRQKMILKFSDIVDRANIIHNNKYLYIEILNYSDNKGLLEIICPFPNHGIFSQIINDHLRGAGCPECQGVHSTLTFVIEANKVHDNKYNYSETIYEKSNKKVKIICYSHGAFYQRPNRHLMGDGCPKCNKIISKMEVLWLNSIGVPEELRHKSIKINNKRYHCDALNEKDKIIWEFNGDFWHGNPEVFDPNKYNKTFKMTFGEKYQKTIDRENELKAAGYDVISIWESDWKKIVKGNK